MKRSEMPARKTPFRACGKRYPTAEEAARSKAVVEHDEEVVPGCPCGGFHTEKPAGKPRTALRPQGRDDGPTPAVRKAVLERDGFACVCCGKSIMGQRYSLGHRVRAAQGGKAVPENLVTLLGWGGEACHGRIDLYRDPDDGVKGYRLPSTADPAAVPVLIVSAEADAFWAWLTPDGRYATEPPAESAA